MAEKINLKAMLEKSPPTVEFNCNPDFDRMDIEPKNLIDGDNQTKLVCPCDPSSNLFSLKFLNDAQNKPPKIRGFSLVSPFKDFATRNSIKSFVVNIKTEKHETISIEYENINAFPESGWHTQEYIFDSRYTVLVFELKVNSTHNESGQEIIELGEFHLLSAEAEKQEDKKKGKKHQGKGLLKSETRAVDELPISPDKRGSVPFVQMGTVLNKKATGTSLTLDAVKNIEVKGKISGDIR